MLITGMLMILIAQVHLLCKYIVDQQVFDIDYIRNTYSDTAFTMYIRGCQDGLREYPEEYRKSDRGFNENSPANWCYEQGRLQEPEINDNTARIGRKTK